MTSTPVLLMVFNMTHPRGGSEGSIQLGLYFDKQPDGLRRISPSCRSYWAKLDARGFSSTSWVSASRSQNLASVSHAHLSSRSLQVFALRRHSLTSMRLLLLLSDIGQLWPM